MKLKVAVLEDSKTLLKDLIQILDETRLVDVVAWATNSDEFIEKVKVTSPEALILDIDLSGDNMSGLDIAGKLKLPVLFVSGKIGDFYKNIEDLNLDSKAVIEHISKPITAEKLGKILQKFIDQINALNRMQFVYLDFPDSKRNKIAVDTIVYLGTDKNKGSESNNKEIYFSNRKSEILIDFSFTKMAEKGFGKNTFITIHKSFRVNVNRILSYKKHTHEIEVSVFTASGTSEIKLLPVSANYRSINSKHLN